MKLSAVQDSTCWAMWLKSFPRMRKKNGEKMAEM